MKKLLAIFPVALLLISCSSNTQTNQIIQTDFRGDPDHLLIDPPEHGYVTTLPATKWEESMLTGNGTIGALVIGQPLNERIILSHEKLFMPEFPPTAAPDLGANLETIRRLVLEGKGEEASALAVELGKDQSAGPGLPVGNRAFATLQDDELRPVGQL